MPRCRFLFACDIGDPISCLYVGDSGCIAGSMLGKVWLFSFQSAQAELLTAFSDEGIRGLHMAEEHCYAIVSEECRTWRWAKPHAQAPPLSFRGLDKKSSQSAKHVLHRGPWACALFPASSSVVDVTRHEHRHRAFKLSDFGCSTALAPCDFDGESVLFIDRSLQDTAPMFRVVHLESNHQTDIVDLPKASRVSLARLWGPDCIACVVGRALHLYDYRKQKPRLSLHGHRAEIVAVDARDAGSVASLSSDAAVKVWSGVTGECLESFHVPEASFFLGYPYHLCVQEQRFLVAADEGVYLVESDNVRDCEA